VPVVGIPKEPCRLSDSAARARRGKAIGAWRHFFARAGLGGQLQRLGAGNARGTVSIWFRVEVGGLSVAFPRRLRAVLKHEAGWLVEPSTGGPRRRARVGMVGLSAGAVLVGAPPTFFVSRHSAAF